MCQTEEIEMLANACGEEANIWMYIDFIIICINISITIFYVPANVRIKAECCFNSRTHSPYNNILMNRQIGTLIGPKLAAREIVIGMHRTRSPIINIKFYTYLPVMSRFLWITLQKLRASNYWLRLTENNNSLGRLQIA